MTQQELARAAKDQAGGSSAKLASLTGWKKSTIDGWSAPQYNRAMPEPARLMMELLCEVPEAREWLLRRAAKAGKP